MKENKKYDELDEICKCGPFRGKTEREAREFIKSVIGDDVVFATLKPNFEKKEIVVSVSEEKEK